MAVSTHTVNVRIKCEVEIEVGQWGGDNQIDKLTETAEREGLHILQSLIEGKGRICGQPRAVFVVSERK